MQDINQIVRYVRNEIGTSKPKSSAITKSKQDAVQLLKVYNPSLQSKCASYPERCVMGNAPSLAVVRKEYGEQVALDWLVIEINNYQNFVAVKGDNELSQDIVNELAGLILANWYWLKLSELMLFFSRLKSGRYGENYGRINPQNLLCKLRQFQTERAYIIDQYEQEQRRKADEESRKNAISYDEHLKLQKLKGNEQDV